jgi:hypothetical protein
VNTASTLPAIGETTMKLSVLVWTSALVVASGAMSLVPRNAQAQQAPPAAAAAPAEAQVPRTPWGHPDLQGYWTNTTTTPLERPDDLKGTQVLTAEELEKRDAEVAARVSFDRPSRQGDPGAYNEFWMERGRLNPRTSLVVDPPDGRVPPLTPDGQRRFDALTASRKVSPADSWLDRSAYDRCITRGMPGLMMPGFYNHNYHILQTPTHVVVHVEMIHDARIIPIDGRPHLPSGLELWLGDSRGRWEGDTLVVETRNVNDAVWERPQSVVALGVGRELRLVERFRRIDANTLDYQFTIDSPTVYTKPWTVSTPMDRIEGPLFEYACHEGNHGLTGILGGARAEERAAAGGGR